MGTKRSVLITGLLALCGMLAYAQEQPTVITGATVHIGNGQVFEQGQLLYHRGKIVEVGQQVKVPEGAKQIDAKGKHLYPGIICLNTIMGVNEIDAIRATRDYSEAGKFNPNVRTLIAYNTDSKILPTAVFNGILMAQVVPQGGQIAGQSSLVNTAAWNWEDAQVKADDGVHLYWPELQPWGDVAKQQERLATELKQLDDFFVQAFQYCNTARPEVTNLRFEAMKGVFSGTRKLFIHVTGADAIVRSINFTKQYPLMRPVLVGAEESYRVIPFIHSNAVPVVVNIVHRLPYRNQEDVDMPYKLPALLMRAGITVAIGNSGSWESRNVMFNAGTAAAYGLSKEEALSCITLNAAKVCGAEDRTGSLEIGKLASFIISEGDVLDMRSNNITLAVINGEAVDLMNEQQELYLRFMRKYNLIK